MTFSKACEQVVVIDHLFHRTSLKADAVLPAATFAEGEGTLVSSEGRAQRYFQVFPAPDMVLPSWRWLKEVMSAKGLQEGGQWRQIDHVIASMCAEIPCLRTGSRRGAFRCLSYSGDAHSKGTRPL